MSFSKFWPFLRRSVLVSYIALVLWILLFINMAPFNRMTQHYHDVKAQLIPFQNTFYYLKSTVSSNFHPSQSYLMLSNIVGNILLFIPWGIFSPTVFTYLQHRQKLILSALVFSLIAESLQYIFQLGVFDVDDIILNTLGATLGYALLQCSYQYFHKKI